jgi:hypothetical protein
MGVLSPSSLSFCSSSAMFVTSFDVVRGFPNNLGNEAKVRYVGGFGAYLFFLANFVVPFLFGLGRLFFLCLRNNEAAMG